MLRKRFLPPISAVRFRMALHVFVFLLVVCLLLSLARFGRLDWLRLRPSSSRSGCIGYLGHPFKKEGLGDGEKPSSSACTHRWVGVESDVVNSRLMLERQYTHVMEKLLVWQV